MGETQQYNNLHHYQAGAAATSSRVGMRNPVGPGEIVEVQGGHIVRSTGRKDRHSKVCTAKGPRDRRVRLSAHTAIQFYDVQDRLGYDRPSKAVDWLIKKAKTAIDELAELPAWKPTTTASPTTTTVTKARTPAQHKQQQKDETYNNDKQHEQEGSGGSNEREYNPQMDSFQITFQQHHHPPNPRSGFLPPSLDSDAIADTIKSFFPMGSGGGDSNAAHSLSSFQNYPVPDLLSRTSSSSHNQDLRLSLQSFKEPILGHQHEQNHHHQVLFSGPAAAQYLGYDGFSSSGGGWLEHHHQQHQNQVELGRFQRMVASWSAGGTVAGADSNGGSGGGGFIFNSIPLMQQPTESVLLPVQAAPQLVQPMLFGQNQLQRGPLQSSHTPSVRAWIDPADQISQIHPAMGFSPGGGFSGFRVPARIQGDEEEHDCIPKPSSASSDSRH